MVAKFFTFLFSAFALLVLLWAIGLIWFSASVLTAQPPESTSLKKADAIIVLTGGKNRVSTGLTLLSDKLAPRLFISGVSEGVSLHHLTKPWQKQTGKTIPAPIILGYDARDTHGNAIETQAWCAKNNILSILLVTSDYHMPRARLELHRVAPSLTITPIVVKSTPKNTVEKKHFWSLVFEEYHKTLITRFLRR